MTHRALWRDLGLVVPHEAQGEAQARGCVRLGRAWAMCQRAVCEAGGPGRGRPSGTCRPGRGC